MKIAIIGTGYVGFANALVLAKHHEVICLDTCPEKVELINQGYSPLPEKQADELLLSLSQPLSATTSIDKACKEADYMIFSVPTNYDEYTNNFDTSILVEVIKNAASINQSAPCIIRSTIPVGFTESLQGLSIKNEIIFVPEFLREGLSIHDALYPSRIIIGCKIYSPKAEAFAKILLDSTVEEDAEILHMNPAEAETVKLFANTYLAMRVSFFNELDTFAIEKSMNARDIIDGLSLDPRIGDHYNNPSFGYGGYCLPKDTKQMLSSFGEIPQVLIESVIASNEKRKAFITDNILEVLDNPKGVVGVFRLIMKSNSDNFRSSAALDIALSLLERGIKVLIYEPNIKETDVKLYSDFMFEDDLKSFKLNSNIIVANRITEELDDVHEKIYTRDIFNIN